MVVLRHLSDKLELGVTMDCTKLGTLMYYSDSLEQVYLYLATQWKHWKVFVEQQLRLASEFLLPVFLDEERYSRDVIFLRARRRGGLLQDAGVLEVTLHDPVGRLERGTKLARILAGVLQKALDVQYERVDVEQSTFPEAGAPEGRGLASVALAVAMVGRAADLPVMSETSVHFTSAMGRALLAWLHDVRARLVAAGEEDVLTLMLDEDECLAHLNALLAGEALASVEEVQEPAEAPAVGRAMVSAPDLVSVLEVLSWNVSGGDVSCQAPVEFAARDKEGALQQEILRWEPGVVVLQEAAGSAGLPLLTQECYVLMGACAGPAGHVQLYLHKRLCARRQGRACAVVASGAAVGVELSFGDIALRVVGVHLPAEEASAPARARFFRDLFSQAPRGAGAALLVVGDLNCGPDELRRYCEQFGAVEVGYHGHSWDMQKNKYHAEHKALGASAPQRSFDGMLLAGPVHGRAELAGVGRVYFAGAY